MMSRDNTEKFVEWKTNEEHSVWRHFLRATNGQLAKCKACASVLKTTGGSTKGLHTHLKSIHKISKTNVNDEASGSNPAKKQRLEERQEVNNKGKITNFFIPKEDNSLPTILARMIAKDGLSFHVICTSTDIRAGLIARGFSNIPKSPHSIREMVFECYFKIKSALIQEIQKHKSTNGKFSLCFDEWTSLKNRRYININLFFSGFKTECWNLGLVRIRGSMSAETCVELLTQKLKDFNISLENDVFSFTTDGASVMVKVGKLLSTASQQLCFAHGIQLAVLDTLYKKSDSIESTQITESATDSESDEEDNIEDDISADEYFEGIDPVIDVSLESTIKKIRKTVKLFRRSAIKNEILQKYIREKLGKEKMLILDTQIRWNSLVDMLERFLELKPFILKSLIDIYSDINFSEKELVLVTEIVSVLKLTKITVEALCRMDSNLISCDAALKFMLQQISAKQTTFSKKMECALRTRIGERHTILSGVLQYLHHGKKTTDKGDDSLFQAPTHSAIKNYIKQCCQNFKIVQSTVAAAESQQDGLSDSEIEIGKENNQDLESELNSVIRQSLIPAPENLIADGNLELQQMIAKEIRIFDDNGHKGILLQKIYEYLYAVVPTSVESERAFSAAGNIVSKIRNRLNDNSIDRISFLKFYFTKNS